MPSKREVVADDLNTIVDDLKGLWVALTTDPKEQRRMEMRWRLLYGGLSAVMTLAARRLATKSWAILTGEAPPTKRAAAQQATAEPEPPAPREEEQPTAVTHA